MRAWRRPLRAAAPHARRPAPARSARRVRRAPRPAPDPNAAPGARPGRPAPRRDRTIDRCRDISRSRRQPLRALPPPRRSPRWQAASAACAPDRSHPVCAFHSAAIASASARAGAASGLRAGVFTGLPSSSTGSTSPPSPAVRLAVEALAQPRPHGAARRLGRIERLVFENLGKNVAHRDFRDCAPQKGNGTGRPRSVMATKYAQFKAREACAAKCTARAAMLPPLSGSEKASEDL